MRVLTPNIQLNDPVAEVFKRIAVRAPFRQLCVFEPFVGDGMVMTSNYAHLPWVECLEGWEIDPIRASVCKKWIPSAQIKACDAYKEIHKLKPAFDTILIDNNLVQAPRFEHFDLFPSIFKGLKDESFLIISVCHDPGGYYVQREPRIRSVLGSRVDDFVKDWDNARTAFYGWPDIREDQRMATTGRIMPLSEISANDMVPVYTELAIKSRFFTVYHAVVRRSKHMSYILLELKKGSDRQALDQKKRDKIERQTYGKRN